MTTQHNDDPQGKDAFETSLRQSAEKIHPRAAFVQGLRRELNRREPQPHQPLLRRLLPQAAALVALGALVALAVFLTPHLVEPPAPGGQVTDGTPQPGQPELPTGSGLSTSSGLPNGALARLGRGQIIALDVAPDGRLAVASTMGVCVYHDHYQPLWCAEMGSPYSLGWLLFNPAGDRLALVSTSPSPDGLTTRLLVLDAADGTVLAERAVANLEQFVAYTGAAIAWDPTGEPRLALPDVNSTLQVWDYQANANVLGPLDLSDLVSGANKTFAVDWALDPQGRALLAAGGSEGLMIVDTITGVEVLRMDRAQPSVDIGEVSTLDFSADGSWLAYGYANGAAAVRIQGDAVRLQGDAVVDRREWKTFYQPRQVAFGAMSMGNVLAVQEVGYISLFSLDEDGGAGSTRISSSFGPFDWSGAGLYYLRGDGMLGSYQEGEELVVPMQYANWPERIAWGGAGEITALRNASITRWDVPGAQLGSVSTAGEPDQNLDDLAISPDGTRAAFYISGADGVQIWDIPNNRLVVRFDTVDFKAQAAFSADNSRLVTVDRTGYMIVWDAASGSQIRSIGVTGVDAQQDALAVSPNGVLAALAWFDRSALRLDVWNLETAQMVYSIPLDTDARTLAFSPDSARLAVGSEYIQVYDAATGSKVQSMGPEFYDMASDVVYRVPGSQIETLAWSPDGQTLASGGGLVTLWDVAQGLPIRAYGGHRGYVNSLAFRPDGLALASASNDGTILVWDSGAGPQPTAEPLPTGTPVVPAVTEPAPVVVTEVVTEEPTETGSSISYTVVDGDTCNSIAATFNVPVERLKALNGLDEACTNLTVGQILRIPGPAPEVSIEYGPRTEGDEQAAQTLVEFLSALALKDYARAAQYYGSDLSLDGQTYADAAALLQQACEGGGYVCLHPKRITAKSYFGAMGGFDFTVTFAAPDGPDYSVDGQSAFLFSVRPGAPGPYRVVNLPLHPFTLPPTQAYPPVSSLTMDQLIEAIYASEGDYERFSAVMERLAELGPGAVDASSHIAAAIKQPPHYANLAAKTLISLGPEITSTTLPVLLDHLDSGGAETRTYALVTLGTVGPAASCAVGEVGKLLWDADPTARFAAAWALEGITGEDLLPESARITPDPLTANQFVPDTPEGSVTEAARQWWLATGSKVNWRPAYGPCDP